MKKCFLASALAALLGIGTAAAQTTVRNTVIVEEFSTPELVTSAFGVDVKLGATSCSIGYTVEGTYKVLLGSAWYFSPGISVGGVSQVKNPHAWGTLEVGVPLTIGYSELNYSRTVLYGEVGVTPTYYNVVKSPDGYAYKKNGFLLSPIAEFGFNIPADNLIWRVGIWGEVKLNTNSGLDNVYKRHLGDVMAGVKVGLLF